MTATASLPASPREGTDAAGAGGGDNPMASRTGVHTPTPLPGFVCDHTGDARRACLFEHVALMRRLRTYA